jgi:hypothetical protein
VIDQNEGRPARAAPGTHTRQREPSIETFAPLAYRITVTIEGGIAVDIINSTDYQRDVRRLALYVQGTELGVLVQRAVELRDRTAFGVEGELFDPFTDDGQEVP